MVNDILNSNSISLEEIREIAKKKLMGICGVYKDCDGSPARVCQGQSYGKYLRFGGIGSGASFNNNFLACAAIKCIRWTFQYTI